MGGEAMVLGFPRTSEKEDNDDDGDGKRERDIGTCGRVYESLPLTRKARVESAP